MISSRDKANQSYILLVKKDSNQLYVPQMFNTLIFGGIFQSNFWTDIHDFLIFSGPFCLSYPYSTQRIYLIWSTCKRNACLGVVFQLKNFLKKATVHHQLINTKRAIPIHELVQCNIIGEYLCYLDL